MKMKGMNMLELKKITKKYLSGTNSVSALKGIDLKFRETEFVSILGPSGCGKTTLLNIIGGLDQYTTGDLIINGKSTKNFKDKDWDTYRNHSIGFVFQNYNLIPHQTVLANVELALTLAGINKTERRKRAIKALKDVGLEDQIYKKPNQMSGGQMQRVAIARALVSNPDILLADEPTGALDTKTSVQIMELLKEISKTKLVIMVTHNPDLAEKYSTRIIKLLDGQVIDDSKPFKEAETKKEQDQGGKTNMSFATALSLSLNNLLTKKGRTILTSFAGSIGIIGIALILSLSSGMQSYINKVEEDTLSSYPITLQETTMDTEELLSAATSGGTSYEEYDDNLVHSMNITNDMLSLMSSGAKTNNLEAFKAYIEDNEDTFFEYANAIQYSYNLDLNIYKENDDGYTLVNPEQIMSSLGMGGISSLVSGSSSYTAFSEMLDNEELINDQYEVLAGHLPEDYNEVVIVVNKDNYISDYTLYAIGLLDSEELIANYQALLNGEEVKASEEISYSYDELLEVTFKVLLNTDYYTKEGSIWIDNSNNEEYISELLKDALELEVVGIIRPKEDTITTNNYGSVWYTKELTEYVITAINESEIAKEQLANPDINVFTNEEFTDEEFNINNLSSEQQAYLATLSQEELAEVIASYQANATATLDDNLEKLGVVDLAKPSTINIYAKDFDSKEALADLITEYNNNTSDEYQISYTDIIEVMMSGVSSIIDIISYVLMGFVSISLVVSSIMIGIITYISVLERTKEIGILRSIGASKKDISRVFNAETLIIGAGAGMLGIILTIVLNIPINLIINNLTGVSSIAKLPVGGAIILVVISMLLTVVAGLIPAKMASKKDPVEALRTE